MPNLVRWRNWRQTHSNEEDEDDDIHASGSDGSDGSIYECRVSTPPPPSPPPPQISVRYRDQHPQPQQTQSAPDASVRLFSGASGFRITGGSFTSIGGTVFRNPASPNAAGRVPHIPVSSSAGGTLHTKSTSSSSKISPAMPTAVSTLPSFLPRLSNTLSAGSAMDVEEPPEIRPMSNTTSVPFNNPAEERLTETISCWIAAERALHHAQAKHPSVARVFNAYGIAESEYHVQVGFDEELIKSGIGYLEQIHVFVAIEVDASSPILSELGAIFSPFPSMIFTEKFQDRLPAHKEDGSIWQFEEMVYFNAVKFSDGGRTAKTPLTAISYYSQTHNVDSGTTVTGVSNSSCNNEDDPMEGNTTPSQGTQGEGGNDNQEDGEDTDDDDSSDDPDDPPEGQTGSIPGSSTISFDISSDIYPTNGRGDLVFQNITVHGKLIIETTPQVEKPPQFSERRIRFTQLKFDTEHQTSIAYEQFYVRVAIDSNQANAFVIDLRPRRTTYSDGEEKLISSSKTARSRGVSLGLNTQGSLSGTMTKTSEENKGTELKRYTSSISQHDRDGNIRWGFNVEDPKVQKGGIDMPDNTLPDVCFQFVGNSKRPKPPPKHVDTVISSYWSMMIPSGEPRSTWFRNFFQKIKLFGKDHKATSSYTNLFNIVILRTAHDKPSKHQSSQHKATVDVRSGVSEDPQVQRRAAKSVDITPLTVDDLEKPHNPNIPTIAKLELSTHCIPILETLHGNSKSH